MKNILLYIILIFCSTVFAHDQPEDYRYNPFQFTFPEHQLKAESVPIDSISQLPDNYKTVEFNGYQFYVPESSILQTEKGIPRTLAVLDKNKKGLFLITLNSSNVLICEDTDNRKDYCSVFDTRREYLVKLYTLTPEDLSQPKYASTRIGHSWIVYNKANLFENVTDIKMYERTGFIFFRQNRKPPHPMAHKAGIFISSPKNDELLDIIFLVKDEKLIMDVIKSFQLITKP